MTTPPQQPQPDFLKLLMSEVDKAISKVRKEQPSASATFFGLLDSLLSTPTPDSPYDDPRTSTEESSRLPTLRAGIYRHWKHGHLYQVLGYAKDSEPPSHDQNRIVVVYFSTKPTTSGHSMFTRPVQHFFDQVCLSSGRPLGSCNQHLNSSDCKLVDRFTYVGPEYPA